MDKVGVVYLIVRKFIEVLIVVVMNRKDCSVVCK